MIRFQMTGDEVRQLTREQQSDVARRYSDPSLYKLYLYLLMPATIATVAVICSSFLKAILAFGLYWGMSSGINRWQRARYSKSYYSDANLVNSLLPFELELLADRLKISNANAIYQYYWHGFHFLRETPRYFHLYFSPISKISVPKNAFASETELAAFRDAVKSHNPKSA